MLRGDVDNFYRSLRRRSPRPGAGPLPDLEHVRQIAEYYRRIPVADRQLLLAWARKEEAGIGMIPLTLSSVPLIGLLFAPLIQGLVRDLAPWVWFSLWALAALGLFAGFYVHQRQKAYTTLHVQLLEHLCKEAGGRHDESGHWDVLIHPHVEAADESINPMI